MQDYKIQLDTYSGPMDLLLYLIRRDEVDIYDIPISGILEQFLQHVRLLKVLDPDVVGDFLVLAATLMEIKSRMLLPKPPPEEDDDDSLDPRTDLIRQLLAYRAFREAAGELHHRADAQAKRFNRPATDLPKDEQQVDIEDVQIWDLLTAFNKLLASVGQQRATHDILYDDTPITLHATDILDRLEREGPAMPFEKIFEGRTHGEMIGLFLALLELIRQNRIRVDQPEPLGPILIHLLDATPITELADSEDEQSFEADEEEDEPTEAVSELEETTAIAEEFYEDDEDDEFRREIDAVQIDEVDLGRSLEETSTPDEPDSLPDSKDEA